MIRKITVEAAVPEYVGTNVINFAEKHATYRNPAYRFEVSSRKIIPAIDAIDYLKIYYPYLDLDQIDSVFGNAVYPSRFYGGRIYDLEHSLTDRQIDTLNEQGKGVSLTLTGHHFDEEVFRAHNAPDLEAITGSKQLVTLRVISALTEGIPSVVLANLEIPMQGKEGCCLIAIDPETGITFLARKNDSIDKNAWVSGIVGKQLPCWHEVVRLCEAAHACFADLATIGWDVVCTDAGIKLLEGNINWGTASHQITTDMPLLETSLLKAWSQTPFVGERVCH